MWSARIVFVIKSSLATQTATIVQKRLIPQVQEAARQEAEKEKAKAAKDETAEDSDAEDENPLLDENELVDHLLYLARLLLFSVYCPEHFPVVSRCVAGEANFC